MAIEPPAGVVRLTGCDAYELRVPDPEPILVTGLLPAVVREVEASERCPEFRAFCTRNAAKIGLRTATHLYALQLPQGRHAALMLSAAAADGERRLEQIRGRAE